MFKRLGKDITGGADICTTVSSNFDVLAVASYVLPGEEILFAFQSAKEEFVFTNEALLVACGATATTTRRLVKRYEFRENQLTNVTFETTGRVDRDCEIKFDVGKTTVSIDIARKEEQVVKKYYKALVALAREQHQRRCEWSFMDEGLKRSALALYLNEHRSEKTLGENPHELNCALPSHANHVLEWMKKGYAHIRPRCYRECIVSALQQ